MTPFVARRIGTYTEVYEDRWAVPKKKVTGEDYLNMWKDAGGHDFVDPVADKSAKK